MEQIKQVGFTTSVKAPVKKTAGEDLMDILNGGAKLLSQINIHNKMQEKEKSIKQAKYEKEYKEKSDFILQNQIIKANLLEAEFVKNNPNAKAVDYDKFYKQLDSEFGWNPDDEYVSEDNFRTGAYYNMTMEDQQKYAKYKSSQRIKINELINKEAKDSEKDFLNVSISTAKNLEQIKDFYRQKKLHTDEELPLRDIVENSLKNRFSIFKKQMENSDKMFNDGKALFTTDTIKNSEFISFLNDVASDDEFIDLTEKYSLEIEKYDSKAKRIKNIASGIPMKNVDKKEVQTVLNNLINTNQIERAIAVSSNNNVPIQMLDGLKDRFETSQQDFLQNSYNLYNATKDVYNYKDSTREYFEVLEYLAKDKFDLSTVDGLRSAREIMKKDAFPQEKITKDDLKSLDGLDSDEEFWVIREAKKFQGYVTKEKAIEIAYDRFEDSRLWSKYVGIYKNDEQYGLIAKNHTELDTIKQFIASTVENSQLNITEDDVDFTYDKVQDVWYVNNGEKLSAYKSSQLKQMLNKQKAINEIIDITDKAIKKEYGEDVYVDGKDSDEKINNLNNFFQKQLDTFIKDNNLNLSDKEKKLIKIRTIEKYKDEILSKNGIDAVSKNEIVVENFEDFEKEKLIGKVANTLLNQSMIKYEALDDSNVTVNEDNVNNIIDTSEEISNIVVKQDFFHRWKSEIMGLENNENNNSFKDGKFFAFIDKADKDFGTENHTKTIGYGYRLTKEEQATGLLNDGTDWTKGITRAKAFDLFNKSFYERGLKEARRIYNSASKEDNDNIFTKYKKFEELPKSFQYILGELAYNTGNSLIDFKELKKSINNDDINGIIENIDRKIDGKMNNRRVQYLRKIIKENIKNHKEK